MRVQNDTMTVNLALLDLLQARRSIGTSKARRDAEWRKGAAARLRVARERVRSVDAACGSFSVAMRFASTHYDVPERCVCIDGMAHERDISEPCR